MNAMEDLSTGWREVMGRLYRGDRLLIILSFLPSHVLFTFFPFRPPPPLTNFPMFWNSAIATLGTLPFPTPNLIKRLPLGWPLLLHLCLSLWIRDLQISWCRLLTSIFPLLGDVFLRASYLLWFAHASLRKCGTRGQSWPWFLFSFREKFSCCLDHPTIRTMCVPQHCKHRLKSWDDQVRSELSFGKLRRKACSCFLYFQTCG